jgi:hypothetical protein
MADKEEAVFPEVLYVGVDDFGNSAELFIAEESLVNIEHDERVAVYQRVAIKTARVTRHLVEG